MPLSSCLFNLPHSLCKAASMIQWHGEGCCTNHPWAGYHWRLASIALEGTWSLQSHLPGWCERMYFIFSLHVETSSSWLSKNIKALMANLASSLLWWGIPTVLPRGCQDVFIGVLGKDGWDKVSDSCPKCGTALKEGRKLVTECFPHYTLQAELEYLFSLDGQLMEDQQILCSEQRQCNAQMERLTYLQDMNPGKILCHLLNGLCYQVNNHSVQHEITCAITCALNEPLATIFIVFYFFWLWIFSVWSLMDCGLGLKYPNSEIPFSVNAIQIPSW